MRAIYVAHPLGPDGPEREWNRRNAAKWCAWIASNYIVATIADWIVLSGEWSETEENRKLGIEIDLTLVARCDEVWMVGKRVSAGMVLEASEAVRLGKPVIDFTGTHGGVPPNIPKSMLVGFRWDRERLPGVVIPRAAWDPEGVSS